MPLTTDEKQAAEAAATYIVQKLKEERYHTRRLARIICLYSGEATIELAAIKRAQEMQPFKLETLYLVDIDHKFVNKKEAEKLARKVVMFSFEDLNKLLIKTPFKSMAFTVCLAVHPQIVAFAPKNTTAILYAYSDQKTGFRMT